MGVGRNESNKSWHRRHHDWPMHSLTVVQIQRYELFDFPERLAHATGNTGPVHRNKVLLLLLL